MLATKAGAHLDPSFVLLVAELAPSVDRPRIAIDDRPAVRAEQDGWRHGRDACRSTRPGSAVAADRFL
jgi:hypothetical protein